MKDLPTRLIFWGAWTGCYAMGVLNGALLSEAVSLTVFAGGMVVYGVCNAVSLFLHQRDHKRFMREMSDAERRIIDASIVN